MDTPESVEHVDLTDWDWKAELVTQDRSMAWLARRTGKADMTVYRYARSEYPAPVAWLERAWRILHGEGVA